ncbi:MAG: hypothetical protein K6T73_04840 [Candidatus Bathyarchaeota archaeon]|nr:hypothetical protein [Candidatus Bathyarchaeota archaeon]
MKRIMLCVLILLLLTLTFQGVLSAQKVLATANDGLCVDYGLPRMFHVNQCQKTTPLKII